MRGELWEFNRFSPGKPRQKRVNAVLCWRSVDSAVSAAIGPQPSQDFANLRRVFFIDSRVLILASTSAIFASAGVRISALVLLPDARNDSSSRISFNEKPSSFAR